MHAASTERHTTRDQTAKRGRYHPEGARAYCKERFAPRSPVIQSELRLSRCGAVTIETVICMEWLAILLVVVVLAWVIGRADSKPRSQQHSARPAEREPRPEPPPKSPNEKLADSLESLR